jgi:hypothetical protein
MKNIMKNIIAFFVSIWNFFFGKKVVEPVKAEPKTLEQKMEEMEYRPKKRYQKRIVPSHNNRKKTRGRYFQVVPTGRVIYHYAR